MTDARRRQEAEKERGAHKGLDRLGGLSRIKASLCYCLPGSSAVQERRAWSLSNPLAIPAAGLCHDGCCHPPASGCVEHVWRSCQLRSPHCVLSPLFVCVHPSPEQLGEDKPFLEMLPDVIRSYGMSMMYGERSMPFHAQCQCC